MLLNPVFTDAYDRLVAAWREHYDLRMRHAPSPILNSLPCSVGAIPGP